MNEHTLAEVFAEVYRSEFSEFDCARGHLFSRRHRRAMKNILSPRAFSLPAEQRNIPIKKRLVLALLVILLSLLGIAAGAEIMEGFSLREDRGHKELCAVINEDAPMMINMMYHLPTVPSGFKPFLESEDVASIFSMYNDDSADRVLFFYQGVKNDFSIYLDDPPDYLEEMTVNGWSALYLCYGADYGAIVWDNEDYILEVGGDFTKNELVALAESVQIKKI